jgi:hypothetical protein
MLVSDVLNHKGPEVVRVLATDTVMSAVRKLSERRIGWRS